MKGLFVDSTYRFDQGATDFGYYIDGDESPESGSEVEKMVDDDEAFFVEVFPVQNNGVFIRLSSENRRITSELNSEIGFRRRGLKKVLYQSTGDPVLPRKYDSRDERDEAISTFAEYVLEHGEAEGLRVEGVGWDSLLEQG
ncbi:MAG: hypothetical protein ACLFRK_01750 [Candidatus Nanohaloarchaea archaeon]